MGLETICVYQKKSQPWSKPRNSRHSWRIFDTLQTENTSGVPSLNSWLRKTSNNSVIHWVNHINISNSPETHETNLGRSQNPNIPKPQCNVPTQDQNPAEVLVSKHKWRRARCPPCVRLREMEGYATWAAKKDGPSRKYVTKDYDLPWEFRLVPMLPPFCDNPKSTHFGRNFNVDLTRFSRNGTTKSCPEMGIPW